MASHRTAAAHAAVFPLRPGSHAPETFPAALEGAAEGEPSLKRAALYARVSTEKQEREETVASQVDLLSKAAAAAGYDIAPTRVFIDDGVSGSRLDRPALDRLRDLVAEGAFEVLLVTVPYYVPLPGPPHAPASMWARAVTESALDRNHYASTAVPLQMPQNEMVPLRMGVC